jgi:SAM-dependent methyltransferase
MSAPLDPEARDYDSLYEQFDSPLMRRVRLESYGEDIGQHSWVIAEELRKDIPRLALSASSRFLDLGCGPCGPLTFILRSVLCLGTGTDVSASALAAGRSRAASLGLESWITLREADLNEALPFAPGSFDSAMSLDVVLHLRDRARLFQEVARTLVPGGRFLFTDAGVITGPVSDQEVLRRSIHGHTQFAAPGFNERLLDAVGFRLLETEDRTASVVKNAAGRLDARLAHRSELEELEGRSVFERRQLYLETVLDLFRRGAMSRVMYLVESSPAGGDGETRGSGGGKTR